MRLIRPIQTRFRFGYPSRLNLATHVTRRLILQKARRHPIRRSRLRLLVSTRFQVLFHSPPGVLFTFPSRYWFTIGHRKYLALGGGPPDSHGFHVSRRTRDTLRVLYDFVTGLLPSLAEPFHDSFYYHIVTRDSSNDLRSHNPTATLQAYTPWFRLFPVRSPLLRESLLFSLSSGY